MHNPEEPAVVVVEVLGIYDADGGLRGEMSYVVGKLLGRAHCGLCDITHSAVRRRRAWDRMVESHDIPVRLAHRNELTADERVAVAGHALPVVLGRTRRRDWHVLLPAARLAELQGSVAAFDRELCAALAT